MEMASSRIVVLHRTPSRCRRCSAAARRRSLTCGVVLTTAGAVSRGERRNLGSSADFGLFALLFLHRLERTARGPASPPRRGYPTRAAILQPSSRGGFYNTLVGLRSGELFCCGENQNGQCGVVPSGDSGNSSGRDDDTRNLKVMTRCAALASRDLQAAAAAAAGYCHTLVLTPRGTSVHGLRGRTAREGDGLPADALPAWEGGNTDDSGSSRWSGAAEGAADGRAAPGESPGRRHRRRSEPQRLPRHGRQGLRVRLRRVRAVRGASSSDGGGAEQ